MYGCKCDHCGKEWTTDEYNGFVAFSDESGMRATMQEDTDWHTEEGKHYCPDCFGGFDDEDNLILK